MAAAYPSVKLAVLSMVLIFALLYCPSKACDCKGNVPSPSTHKRTSKSPPKSSTPSVPKTPTLPSPPSSTTTCPVNIIKLGVCVPLLGGVLVDPTSNDCCALLGILGLDVEVCLCAAIDANVLGIVTLHAKVDVIASILTACGYKVPPNLTCP